MLVSLVGVLDACSEFTETLLDAFEMVNEIPT